MSRTRQAPQPGAILLIGHDPDGNGYVGCYGAHMRVEPGHDDHHRPAILVGITCDHDAGAMPWVVRKVTRHTHSSTDPREGLQGERGGVTVQLVQADHRHEAPVHLPTLGFPVFVGLAEECPYCAVETYLATHPPIVAPLRDQEARQ